MRGDSGGVEGGRIFRKIKDKPRAGGIGREVGMAGVGGCGRVNADNCT